MITTIFMPFSYTFSCYLSVSFLRKTSWISSFIHSLSLKSSSYSFLPPPLPYLSSKCYWETSLCLGAASLHLMQDFSLSQLRKYTGSCIHFARKRYLGTEESTCLRNYVIFGFAHERDLRNHGCPERRQWLVGSGLPPPRESLKCQWATRGFTPPWEVIPRWSIMCLSFP